MHLLELYRRESTVSGVSVIGMAVLSGIANAMLLAIINAAASTASYENLNFRYFLMFVFAFSVFITGKKYALSKATVIAENIIRGLRVRLTDKIRNSELQFLENTGKAEIYNRLTRDTGLLSGSIVVIINACQSAIMLFFCILYIATLSKLAFIFTVATISSGIFIYLIRKKAIDAELQEASRQETAFFGILEHFLDGFKEIKINRRRNDDLFGFFNRLAVETEKLKIGVGLKFVINLMFTQLFFYTLIAIIIFVMPRFGEAYSEVIMRITASVLFIIGPLEALASAIPIMMTVDVSVKAIYDLENRLDAVVETLERGGALYRPTIKPFTDIRLEETVFSYYDKNGTPLFTVGPMDLSIHQGEILFVIGGNGSGKSTFLKLLTGLYYPVSGAIRLDTRIVTRTQYPAYRELFSVIFSDFHLFDRLYGMGVIDYGKIDELLELMELDKKTAVVDGAFTTTDLSTGQRKRLAMIVSLLEDRPIYVFDEWAADQDPNFREYYYNVLLKNLQAQGKTVIAVSHDDRYFHVADRVLKMEFGQFVTS